MQLQLHRFYDEQNFHIAFLIYYCQFIYINYEITHGCGIENLQVHNHTFYFSLQVGERIRVILDCEDNTLAFEKNYEFLGKG